MEFVICFDMRAPDFGAPLDELYRAALEMSAWADGIGFNVVALGEHHAADDGYLPSPLPMAAAIAARTTRVKIRPNVLLAPLYEPVKLAEDLSIVQLLSGGRLQIVIGAGSAHVARTARSAISRCSKCCARPGPNPSSSTADARCASRRSRQQSRRC